MKLLAIDTSTEWCGIAYVVNGKCIHIVEEQLLRKHGEQLPLFYERLKNDSGLNLGELDGITVSIGPGSFTGLRVGLSFAKGLAYSHHISIVPVPTLLVLVHNSGVKRKNGQIILYSHRNIVYYQEYFSDALGIRVIGEVKTARWAEVKPLFKEEETHLHHGCQSLLKGDEVMTETRPSAKSVGILAEKHFDEWVQTDPFHLVPNYISPFEIHTRQ